MKYEIWCDYGGSGLCDYHEATIEATSPNHALAEFEQSNKFGRGIYNIAVAKEGVVPRPDDSNVLLYKRYP